MRLVLLSILCFTRLGLVAQEPYQKGSTIANFMAANILNSSSSSGSFKTLRKKITIIDFFGTWCAPCIRALPNLSALQEKHLPDIRVVLISIEKEAPLKRFIDSRQGFSFPVIVDDQSNISNLFQPPAYPYTVIINSSNEIIAITEAEKITEAMVNGWLLATPGGIQSSSSYPISKPNKQRQTMNSPGQTNNSYTALSAEFIYAAKTGIETSLLETKLKSLNLGSLSAALSTDEDRKAFWINIYNGFTQRLLMKDPGKYKRRSSFFKAKQIAIAGEVFSLDEIEHDILRRSKIKWSLGYLSKWFPGKKAKLLRVAHLDYRIHFALNCGAKSCPPIAFYDPANIDAQLDIAEKAYLTAEGHYDRENNVLELPAFMSWFRHDFNGKANMLRLVKKYSIVPSDKNPSITFKKYDWTLYLNNYKR